MEGFYIIFKL